MSIAGGPLVAEKKEGAGKKGGEREEEKREEDEDGSDGDDENEDEDDADLFAQSYREGSGRG